MIIIFISQINFVQENIYVSWQSRLQNEKFKTNSQKIEGKKTYKNTTLNLKQIV